MMNKREKHTMMYKVKRTNTILVCNTLSVLNIVLQYTMYTIHISNIITHISIHLDNLHLQIFKYN